MNEKLSPSETPGSSRLMRMTALRIAGIIATIAGLSFILYEHGRPPADPVKQAAPKEPQIPEEEVEATLREVAFALERLMDMFMDFLDNKEKAGPDEMRARLEIFKTSFELQLERLEKLPPSPKRNELIRVTRRLLDQAEAAEQVLENPPQPVQRKPQGNVM